ncbi:Uncharacterised protein [uncultured archaeon]|nr:Uncharacterised protein [uncultured archaeon]
MAYAASAFGLPTTVNPYLILFGVLFAFVIGIVSGYVPAKNAAKMAPVEALRYD